MGPLHAVLRRIEKNSVEGVVKAEEEKEESQNPKDRMIETRIEEWQQSNDETINPSEVKRMLSLL